MRKLSKAARYNLSRWKKFLPIWSGTSVIQSTREKVYVAMDASGTKGIGGIEFQTNEVFSTRIPRRHRRKHINWKEMYSILYAFASWSNQWENKKVIIFCNNTGVVCGINKRTIRGKAIEPLQTIFLLAARRNIEVTAVWVPTKSNALADALSRFELKKITNIGGQQLADSLPRRQSSRITSKISQLLHNSIFTTGSRSPHSKNSTPQSTRIKNSAIFTTIHRHSR